MMEDPPGRPGCFSSPNLRALWVLFVVSLVFATAQMTGASVANSLSMFSDSGSMFVDGLSYAAAIWMERRKIQFGAVASRKFEVFTALFSALLLFVVTLPPMIHASSRLKGAEADSENVDGGLVLGFALGNLVAIFIMATSYFYQLRARLSTLGSFSDMIKRESVEQLNMVGAFAHLLSDLFRCLAGISAGSVEFGSDNHHQNVIVDAITAFVVCALILCVVLFVVYQAYGLFVLDRLERRREAKLQEDGINLDQVANQSDNQNGDNHQTASREPAPDEYAI